MRIAIHQPNYLPWIGYFYKMAMSDVFVLYDDVQYTKNSYINRVQIKTPAGAAWLTVPVRVTGMFGQNISDVTTVEPQRWIDKHLKTWEMNYRKSRFFGKYFGELQEEYCIDHDNLAELNARLIRKVASWLSIDTKIMMSSELVTNGASTDRLVSICQALGADSYLSGKGGQKYQDDELFRVNNIELLHTDFIHPTYRQLWGDFLPGLSIMDLLFNFGKDAKTLLLGTS